MGMTLRSRDVMRLSRFIARYCLRPMREHSEIDDVMVLDGSLPLGWTGRDLDANVPSGFRFEEAWSDEPYRLVWTCDAQRTAITYTEGDLDVAVALSDLAWAAYRRSCREFYARGGRPVIA